VRPGETFGVAVVIDLPEGWHTYWLNPGDAGAAPTITWTTTEGVTVGPLSFPGPKRFGDEPLVSFGYDHQAVLLAEATVAGTVAVHETVRLQADVLWLECKDVCIPRRDEVRLELEVDANGRPSATEELDLIRAAAETVPRRAAGWNLRAVRRGKTIRLRLKMPVDASGSPPASAAFFPLEPGIIHYAGGLDLERRDGELTLDAVLQAGADPVGGTLAGVVIFPNSSGVSPLLVEAAIDDLTE
jgi:thiol:disulfide interchange protein DsbD